MWERELMGLYISAHPLDSFETYLREQTQPLSQLKPDYDGREMTLGGIITNVRTIITKSGTRMAFVALEDKFGEGEVIVFPNLYEQVGAKLVQDAVVRVTGKNSARDRDGNLGDESKLIANEIVLVDDTEMARYESTGRVMSTPKMSAAVKKERRAKHRGQQTARTPAPVSTAQQGAAAQHTTVTPAPSQPPQKLYVHIKNPDDHEALTMLKRVCKDNPGSVEIILVLGVDKKSAIRLPFQVDDSPQLLATLVEHLGEAAVVLK